MRVSLLAAALASAVFAAAHARAETLVGLTDLSPNGGFAYAALSDTVVNWAVSWSQASATSNVSISAVLSSHVGAASANWWVTDAIGAGTTMANVVASGTYVAPEFPFDQYRDFNSAPATVLGTGLSFAPGTYYLVLDGPPGPLADNVDWVGDSSANISANLAPGFVLGDYFVTQATAGFAPSAVFGANATDTMFAFSLTGDFTAVPEPATWAMMIAGFGLTGGVMRRRRISGGAAASPIST